MDWSGLNMSMTMSARAAWNQRRVPWKLKLRKAGLKTTFGVQAEFLAEELARNIRDDIDREILNDLLSAAS